jgi:hypothetical protein
MLTWLQDNELQSSGTHSCPPSPGLAPCPILISICLADIRYSGVTPKRPDATCWNYGRLHVVHSSICWHTSMQWPTTVVVLLLQQLRITSALIIYQVLMDSVVTVRNTEIIILIVQRCRNKQQWMFECAHLLDSRPCKVAVAQAVQVGEAVLTCIDDRTTYNKIYKCRLE